jgi:hypothetical protein
LVPILHHCSLPPTTSLYIPPLITIHHWFLSCSIRHILHHRFLHSGVQPDTLFLYIHFKNDYHNRMRI